MPTRRTKRTAAPGSALLNFMAPGLRHVFATPASALLGVAGVAIAFSAVLAHDRDGILPPAAASVIDRLSAATYDTADAVLGPGSDILDAKIDGMAGYIQGTLKAVRNHLDDAVVAVDRRLNPDLYEEQIYALPAHAESSAPAAFAAKPPRYNPPRQADRKRKGAQHADKPSRRHSRSHQEDPGPSGPRF